MRLLFGVVLALSMCVHILRGQTDSVGTGMVEVAGSLLYSRSSLPREYAYYVKQEFETRTYTWAVQSGMGVFVAGYLEVCADVQYTRTRTETDVVVGTYDFPHDIGYRSATAIAIAVGPGYNLPLGARTWMFLQIKAGFSWTSTDEGVESFDSQKWSRTQTLVPVIQGGFKFFFDPHIALILQARYDRLSESKRRSTTFGMGLAIYL